MSDKIFQKELPLEGTARLVAAVSREEFGAEVIAFVKTGAKLNNFGSFYSPDLKRLETKLSLWSGKISDYWFRQTGKMIESHPEVQQHILSTIREAPEGGTTISRWHPTGDDPRVAMFEQFRLIERVAVSSRFGRNGYQSFFLRSKADGWISDAEMEALEQVLPVAHELIALRHRIVGSELFHYQSVLDTSTLRDRNLGGFATLSRRESEVCDCLIQGLTVLGTASKLGIAESSVRTLRRRAYRKLSISSATELMAFMLHAKEAR